VIQTMPVVLNSGLSVKAKALTCATKYALQKGLEIFKNGLGGD